MQSQLRQIEPLGSRRTDLILACNSTVTPDGPGWRPWFFMLSGFVLFSAYLKNPKEETMIQQLVKVSFRATFWRV